MEEAQVPQRLSGAPPLGGSTENTAFLLCLPTTGCLSNRFWGVFLGDIRKRSKEGLLSIKLGEMAEVLI